MPTVQEAEDEAPESESMDATGAEDVSAVTVSAETMSGANDPVEAITSNFVPDQNQGLIEQGLESVVEEKTEDDDGSIAARQQPATQFEDDNPNIESLEDGTEVVLVLHGEELKRAQSPRHDCSQCLLPSSGP